jgi:hypothetical protein
MAWAALAGIALAAAPTEDEVQGYYEGTLKDAAGTHKVEARVVAAGDMKLQILLRQPAADGKVTKTTIDGKIEGDAATFAGKIGEAEFTGAYAADAVVLSGKAAGALSLKRVVKTSPATGAKPPAGAVVLLDGKDNAEMLKNPLKDGTEQPWQVAEDGGVMIPKGGMRSKQAFGGSFRMHVEFKCPLRPKERGQGRGNSGVFMPNGNEIQVLDSFGFPTYTGGGCGGIYKYQDPITFDEFNLTCFPPGQWQTYDVEYIVKQEGGKPVGKPVITVIHNGVKIHDRHELDRPAKPGQFQFQDHGNPVQYRNIWVVEAK